MYIRKLAAAAGFACGAALVLSPLASADSSDWWSSIDGLLSGASPAADTMSDFQISFNGMDLFPTTGNLATATTIEGQYGLAIAYGAGSNAVAEGGIGNYALASGTNAQAEAGSTAAGATTSSYNFAEDIGNTTLGGGGAHDGAYAGGGSLIGNTDASTLGSSHNTAVDIGNNGLDSETTNPAGGNSGAFAGDSGLIGYNHVAGNGDTAYTFGNINGFGDGSASVGGSNDLASTSGAETGTNEGSFAGFGDNNQAIADTSYTIDGKGVDATFGNGNYAYVYGPNNSTADAGGHTGELGNNNIAYVNDPYGNVNAPDSAVAGSSATTAGNSDLAEVLYTHGDASAQGGNNLYDILSLFGNYHSASLPAAADAAAVPAAVTPITTTVSSEVTSLNSQFASEVALAGKTGDLIAPSATANPLFDTIPLSDAPNAGTMPTLLDYELYGVSPIANASSDPGAYDVFNGAEIRFDEAYNVGAYALLNGGALDPNSADIFGAAIPAGDTTAAEVVAAFYNDAIGDLSGFFQANLSAFDTTPAAVTELFSLFGSL